MDGDPETAPDPGRPTAGSALSRRSLLGAAAAGTAGLVVGRLAGPPITDPSTRDRRPAASSSSAPPPTSTPAAAPQALPFFGAAQQGVTTPPQGFLQLAAFDMADDTDRRDLRRLLQDWSAAAAALVEGAPIGETGATGGDPESPPEDTGEAVDLGAQRLTITIGFGPALFERDGVDRYGIAADRPGELLPLPAFPGDDLDPARSDGDLCVQACADDPVVALHAVRNLARVAFRRARLRWSQAGFRQSAADPSDGPIHRNLLGFVDGSNNLAAEARAELAEHVWVPPGSGPAWIAGGSYLVMRKIALRLEGWDNEPLSAQERTFGRRKVDGAPLSGGDPTAAPDFAARVGGRPAIDPAAHVRLAHPSNNGGVRILRRSYDYFDGTTGDGWLEGGLLFLSYQRAPDRFVRIQQSLATDLLNAYTRTVGSALFAVPPGASEGGFVGEGLLG